MNNIFKIGNSVKAKADVFYKDENISHYHGRVIGIDTNTIIVELDSITLKSMPLSKLRKFVNKKYVPTQYNFLPEELELSTLRDTDLEVEQAQDVLIETIFRLEGDIEMLDKKKYFYYSNKWFRHFERSELYNQLPLIDNENNYNYIVESLADCMYTYYNELPTHWTEQSLVSCCINQLPANLAIDKKTSEAYAHILLVFFKFLEYRNYLDTSKLQKSIQEIESTFYERMQNTSLWTTDKNAFMILINKGYLLDDKIALQKILLDYNANISSGKPIKAEYKFLNEAITREVEEGKITHKSEDVQYSQVVNQPKIGRNDLVNVKYTDGTVKEQVKFKKVEADIASGKCALL